MTYEEFESALAPKEPNAVTYAAMEEAEQMGTVVNSHESVKDLMAALEEQDDTQQKCRSQKPGTAERRS